MCITTISAYAPVRTWCGCRARKTCIWPPSQIMKEEALSKANQVINNQMFVAQQIAGLLGETTADTKIILLDLIKQFNQEKELDK